MSTAVESDPVASDRAAVLPAAVAPPQSDTRCFRREMTPTWLSAAVLLGGQRPPHLERSFHVLYLGSASGVTPAVIAAVHPDATVWVWDWRPSSIESTRRLRDAAGLSNLVVNERPVLTPRLDGAVADVIAVEGVLDSAPDDIRDSVFDAVSTSLRPGGVVCISYRTAVGWAEIAPVQRLIRHVASRAGGEPVEHIPEVLDLLRTLDAGGARYLTERPVVAAWVRELHAMDPATIATQYVERDLRPLSHAQVARQLSAIGCTFASSALIADDLGPSAVAGAPADAHARARALNAALVRGEGCAGDGVLAAPLAGTAIPSGEPSQALVERLGAAW